jgi:hypothetical protein
MLVIYLLVATLVGVILAPFCLVTVPSGYVGVLWKRFGGGTVLNPRKLKNEGMRIRSPCRCHPPGAGKTRCNSQGSMAHWPNSSRPALILPALMLRRIDVFDMPTAFAACPRVFLLSAWS